MMRPEAIGSLQNAELTFKYNQNHGRHGWLRLTPAYSVKLVDDILKTSDSGIAVLDPFSGTGTTPLSAAYRDSTGTGVEVNPFLTWLARAMSPSTTYGPLSLNTLFLAVRRCGAFSNGVTECFGCTTESMAISVIGRCSR